MFEVKKKKKRHHKLNYYYDDPCHIVSGGSGMNSIYDVFVVVHVI